MREQRTCGLCGESYPAEELYCFDGLERCPHCLDERTLICEHCGERIGARTTPAVRTRPSARTAMTTTIVMLFFIFLFLVKLAFHHFLCLFYYLLSAHSISQFSSFGYLNILLIAWGKRCHRRKTPP